MSQVRPATTPSRPEAFKPHGIKVAESARDRMLNGPPDALDAEATATIRKAEIKQWKHQVCDLHRVFSVAQGMYLMLEHNNEALLRVAIEIVCDHVASPVLWWTEEWYSDEERRMYFRQIVQGMLAKCLAYQDVEVDEIDTGDTDELQEKLKKALEQLAQSEASRTSMEHSRKMIEDQVRALEGKLEEAKDREAALQKANQALSDELRSAGTKGEEVGPDNGLLAKLKELEQKLKMAEQENGMLQEKLKKAQDKPMGHSDEELAALAAERAALEAQLKAERDRAAAAEEKAAALKKELAGVKSGGKAPAAVVVKDDHELADALKEMEKALAKERRNAEYLQSEKDRMQKDLDKQAREIERLKNIEPETVYVETETARAVEVSPTHKEEKVEEEEKPKPRPSQIVVQQTTEARGPKGISQAEYDKLMMELEKANLKIEAQKKVIREIKEERDDLLDKNDRMLKMLHQLKEQLRKITEIAEKRGCGDLIKSIMDESGLNDTLNSDEFTCFDRLYEDAKRRMEKNRMWEEERMGLRPRSKSPQRAFGGMPNRPLNAMPATAPAYQMSGMPNYQGGMSGMPNYQGGMQQGGMPGHGGYGAPGAYGMDPGHHGMGMQTWAPGSVPVGMWAEGHGMNSPGNYGTSPPGAFAPGMHQGAHGQSPFFSPSMGNVNLPQFPSDNLGLTIKGSGSPSGDANAMTIKPGHHSWANQRPASLGSDLGNHGVYDFDLGMRVVGHGSGAPTPAGVSRWGSPQSVSEGTSSWPLDQGAMRPPIKLSSSHSLGSLSAMAIDAQGLSPPSTAPMGGKRQLGQSKSLSRLDHLAPCSPPSTPFDEFSLENNPHLGTHGIHTERPSSQSTLGPGMFRGFKLVTNRGRKLDPPLYPFPQAKTLNFAEELMQAKSQSGSLGGGPLNPLSVTAPPFRSKSAASADQMQF